MKINMKATDNTKGRQQKIEEKSKNVACLKQKVFPTFYFITTNKLIRIVKNELNLSMNILNLLNWHILYITTKILEIFSFLIVLICKF